MDTIRVKVYRTTLAIFALMLISCGNETSQDDDISFQPPQVRSLADEPPAQPKDDSSVPDSAGQPDEQPPAPPVALDNSRIFVSATASGANNGSSWADAYTDLQGALERAESGSEVWVAAGTYRPHKSDRAVSFKLNAGVILLGGFKGTETSASQRNWKTHRTILSGDLAGNDRNGQGNDENSIHVVACTEWKGTGTVLDGFMVTGGNANQTKPSSSRDGGGVYVSGADLTVKNCFILENFAMEEGGGIFLERATGQITDSVFVRNKAKDGGGCFAEYKTAGTIESCRFSENSAKSDGGGLLAVNVKAKSCTFKKNTADDGGAVFADNSRIKFAIEDSIFEENTVTGRGAAIGSWVTTALDIKRCTFSNNKAGLSGAGIRAYAETLVEDCKFQGNTAKQGGSALDFFSSKNKLVVVRSHFEKNTHDAVSISSCKDALLEDCTFTGNTLGAFGAWEADIKLVRLTFTDNHNDDGYGGAISTAYCSLVMESCKFSGNRAKDRGGAANLKGNEGKLLEIINCTFTNSICSNGGYGGAVYASFFDKGTFSKCTFTGNSAGGGGALSIDIKEARLDKCLFKNNKAVAGGAIYCDVKPKLSGCKFTGNQAEEDKDIHAYKVP